jgi:predicted membrane protein
MAAWLAVALALAIGIVGIAWSLYRAVTLPGCPSGDYVALALCEEHRRATFEVALGWCLGVIFLSSAALAWRR